MDLWERELHVSRIVSGKTKMVVGGRIYYIHSPSRDNRVVANEIYWDTLHDAVNYGLLDDDRIQTLLRARNLWTDKNEEEYSKLPGTIDDLKIKLFELCYQSNARLVIRTALDKGRSEYRRLDNIRHSMDHLTAHGIATTAKIRFLVCSSLFSKGGEPYWGPESWNRNDDDIDFVLEKMVRNRITEPQIREMARSEPWRSTWSAREYCGRGLFDSAAVDISEDQRALILWSGMFDSIRDHPASPDDSVITDDDMLDGWLLIQKRSRDAEKARKKGDELGNEKIRNAHEVFLMADSLEDAKKIDEMNDAAAKSTKAMRMAHLRKKGEVNEMYMPDTWQRFQMELAQAEQKRMKGN